MRGKERGQQRGEEEPSPDAERGGRNSTARIPALEQDRGAGVATSLFSRRWRSGFSLK